VYNFGILTGVLLLKQLSRNFNFNFSVFFRLGHRFNVTRRWENCLYPNCFPSSVCLFKGYRKGIQRVFACSRTQAKQKTNARTLDNSKRKGINSELVLKLLNINYPREKKTSKMSIRFVLKFWTLRGVIF
jgi:hypothetical protein